MGIIDAIKKTAGNVARGAARLVTGKQKQPANTHTEYRQVKQDGDVTITTVSDQPIKKPFSETIAKKVEQHNNLAESVIGVRQTIKQAQNIPQPQHSSFVQSAKQLVNKTKNATSQFIDRAERSTLYKEAHDTTAITGSFIHQAQQVPKVIVKQARKSAKWVKKQNPALVEKLQKTSVRQDISTPGNAFIQSFTGKNPQIQYAKIQKRKEKKTKLGRKVSKKEAKALEKKYGKNWRMAVKQNPAGQYFVNPSQQEFQKIKRQNMLESKSVDFGDVFPNPSMTIGSARQPFVARNIDPMDIDANFIGDRGSGFIIKKDPFDFGDSELTQNRTKSKDPFSVNGFKL